MIDKKKEEYRSQKMDEYINHMITEDVKSSKIVIQGKTKARYWPVKGVGMVAIGKQGELDLFPR